MNNTNHNVLKNISFKHGSLYLREDKYLRSFIKMINSKKDSYIYNSQTISNQNIYIIHLEDWIKMLLVDEKDVRNLISSDVNEVLELINKTSDLIEKVNEDEIDILSVNSQQDAYTSLLKLYTIFTNEMENIQLKCLQRFSNLSNHTPKLFIPFSSTLNRLSSNIISVLNYSDISYNITEYNFEDRVKRPDKNGEILSLTPKIKLSILDENYISNEFKQLPDLWKYYEKRIPGSKTNGTASYTKDTLKRLDLISDIYNLYKINGKQIDDNYFMSYPFILPYFNNDISNLQVFPEVIGNSEVKF